MGPDGVSFLKMPDEVIYYRAGLDTLTCEDCGAAGDHPIELAARCHPDTTAVVAAYHEGRVRLTCAECGSHVATIAVANESIFS